jgi:Zn-dependent alcohol dehydrogenase
MLPGDILGHEMMGEVVEVGHGVNGHLKKGDRVVVPFTIFCGECEQCNRGNFSLCEKSNRKKHLADKAFGHATARLFGYTHLTGGYPGGQAEYLRVPFADVTHIKVPDGIPDEQLLFLGISFRLAGTPSCSATSARATPWPFGVVVRSARWPFGAPSCWEQSRWLRLTISPARGPARLFCLEFV